MGTTRRVLRPILAVPVAIAATALGLLVLVPLVLLLPAARRSVLGAGLARVEKILPGNLTFEEARWHGPLAFRFTGAVWTDEGDTLASFDTLQIAVRPLKLLRHDLSLSRLLARDVRADLPAILERFPKKPQADTTVVQQARQGFFRGGSIPGLLSIAVDTLAIDAPRIVLSGERSVERFVMRGKLSALHGKSPDVRIDPLALEIPADGVALENAGLLYTTEDGGSLAARGAGRLGPEWPFTIAGTTQADGDYSLSIRRMGEPAPPEGEGCELSGRFVREGKELRQVFVEFALRTPGTRDLAKIPAIGEKLASAPHLDGLRARGRATIGLEGGTNGRFSVDLLGNDWVSGGFALGSFAPGSVTVDTLRIEARDLFVSGAATARGSEVSGNVRARASGTAWMAPFVPPESRPDSLVFDLRAATLPGTKRIEARLEGAVRKGGVRLPAVSVEARGSTDVTEPIDFALAARYENLVLHAIGRARQDEEAIRVTLPEATVMEAVGRLSARAELPAAGTARRSLLEAMRGDRTLVYDKKARRVTVDHVQVGGDFGAIDVDGSFAMDAGGTFRYEVAWPSLPAFLYRRLEAKPDARAQLVALWDRSYRVAGQADLRKRPGGMAIDARGTILLPGPSGARPLLPAGANVEGWGPIEGSYAFALDPSSAGGGGAGSWTAFVDLDRTSWLDAGMRARGRGAEAIVDTLALAMPGLRIGGEGAVGAQELRGSLEARLDDPRLVRRFVASVPESTELSLALTAGLSGTKERPLARLSYAGSLWSPPLALPDFRGEAAVTRDGPTEALFVARESIRIGSSSLDSIRVDYRPIARPPGASLAASLRVQAAGEDGSGRLVAAVVRSGKQTTVTGDTLAVSFDGDDLHATEPFRIVSGPPAGLAVENLRMEGSIGSLSTDFTKGPEGVRADVVADLTLPEAPAWAAAVPAGIWPAELTARVHASTADSTVARLRATGLQIGDRKDLEASLALDGQPDRVDAVLALVASNGDSLVAAKALLPAHVDLRALRLVREPGVFSVDGRLSGFPLPPEAAGGGGIAGYLDRSPVERTPKLDGRAVVTGTSGAPDAYLGGRILFPQYRELRDTEVRFEAILRQGTAPPSFPPDLAERPLYGRITEQAGDRHGFHALLAAVRGDRELLHGEAEYPVVVSLVPASAQPVAGEGMRASLDAPGLPLGDLTPLIPQVERLDGSARLHVEATGEAKDPNLDGSMTIPDLRVLLPDGTRATLHGTVYIAGRVQAPEVRGNVTVDNGTIQIPETPENLYPAQGEALLWEGGKTVEVRPDMAQAPTVAKDVRALRSEQTGAIAAVPVFAQLDSASARNRAVAAGEAEGGSEIMKRATIEVHLRIPSGVRLKGHGLDVELTGDIQVTQRNGIPILLGTMRAERGTMEFQGRSLDIESGTVTFYGSPELNPSLDLTLGKRVGDVAITVRLTGTLKQPNLAMSSDPPMSEADIMAMLLFGRPVDQLSNAQNQRLEDRVMATAEQYAADRLTSRLSRELGIDVLQFERSAGDSLGGRSVTVGKYLNPRLLVTYEQDLQREEGYSVSVEYWIGAGFRLETMTRREDQSGANLTWRTDY